MRKVFEMAGLRPPFLPFFDMEDPGLKWHIKSHSNCIILLVSSRDFLPLDLHDLSTTGEERNSIWRGGINPSGGHRLQYGLPSHVEQSGFFARPDVFSSYNHPSSNIGLVFFPLKFSWGTDSSTASYLRYIPSIGFFEMVPHSPIYHSGGFYGAA